MESTIKGEAGISDTEPIPEGGRTELGRLRIFEMRKDRQRRQRVRSGH